MTIDTQRPNLVITENTNGITNSSFTATFTFSSMVSGFGLSDIDIENGSASGLSTTDEQVFTALISPESDGTVTINVTAGKAQDLAGNTNIASNQIAVTYDATRPTVQISENTNGLTNVPFTATFSFSEPVSGFGLSDINVVDGLASVLATDDEQVFTALITPQNNGMVTINVNENTAQDVAGNFNTASNQISVTYDATRPTVQIASSNINQKQRSFTATFSFSEDVSGFSEDDITVSSGSVENFTIVDEQTFIADIVNTTTALVTVDVNENVAQDIAENDNTAASTITVEFDYTAPEAICQDITVYLESNEGVEITADMVDNGSSDEYGIENLVLDKTSFDCSNVGENNVTLTVTDNSGNTSTCTAVITVIDEITVITQDIDVLLDENAVATITPEQIDNGSSNVCGIESLSLDKTSFDCNDIGTNTVTLTVTNVNGESKTGQATVNVVPVNRQPSFSTIGGVSVVEDGGPITVTVEGINNGECANIDQLVTSLTANTTSPIIESIAVSYTEGSETAQLTISIQDDANGEASINVQIQDNGGTDNNGVDSYMDSFNLTVTPVNDAPVCNGFIEPQKIEVGTSLNLELPDGFFTDIDMGDVLTYSATNKLGSWPTWLSVNEETGNLTGTPTVDDLGNVIVKLKATDTGGESAITYIEIIVFQQALSSITGTIYENSLPVERGMYITLYKKRVTTPIKYEVVTRTTNSSQGEFGFYNLAAGTYIVEAAVIDRQAHDRIMTTYYDGSHNWQQATEIQLGSETHQNIDMAMIEKPETPQGNHRIFGTIISKTGTTEKSGTILKSTDEDDAGKPMIGVTVHLKLNGEIIETTQTDENGEYSFENLPEGEYQIEVILPGFEQVDVIAVEMEDATQPEAQEVNMTVWEGTQTVTDIDQLELASTKLYPNPSNGKITLEINNNGNKPFTVGIYSVNGQKIIEKYFKNLKLVKLDLSGKKPGVYLVKTYFDNYQIVNRVILK